MVGQTIDGFLIIREIGRGGMGVVYEAQQSSPRRAVALKVLPPHLACNPQVAARFADEANRMARLEQHPNIVTVYAAGEDDGTPYFAMQLLPGQDLEQHLHQEGRLYLDQAAEIAAQVAEALDYAHQCGVIHRDIKPANIMFDSQGRPLVTDFGIAKAADEYKLTQTGMAIGTPEYSSPEQVKGNPLDGRSDLYSLGVVLYQMVCGQMPFAATTPMAYAVKHVSEPPVPPSAILGDVPQPLEQIILRCLSKEPHSRFANGRELAAVLRGLRLPHLKCSAAPLAVATVYTPTPPPVSSPPRRTALSPLLVVLVVIGGIALIGGLAMMAASTQNGQHQVGSQQSTSVTALSNRGPNSPSPPVVSDPGVPGALSQPEKGNPETTPPPPPPPPPPTQPTSPPGSPVLLGYSNYGFSILRPEGWEDAYSHNGDSDFVQFKAGGTDATFKVEWGNSTEPLEVYPRQQESAWQRKDCGYERILMNNTSLAGEPALRWEFRRNVDGGRAHTIDVFLHHGNRSYAVWCRAPEDQWGRWHDTFEKIINSFQP